MLLYIYDFHREILLMIRYKDFKYDNSELCLVYQFLLHT